MPDANEHLTLLQSKVVARLEAVTAVDAFQKSVPWPTAANGATIPVLSEAKGDLAVLINQATSSLGICLIVLTPTAEGLDPDAAVIAFHAPIVVQVQEFVTANQGPNGTQVPALTLVGFVMRRLHYWSHGLYPSKWGQTIKLQARPYLFLTDTPELTYNVAANAPLNFNATLAA